MVVGTGRGGDRLLITHNYVVVETAALVHRRLGHDAARVLFDEDFAHAGFTTLP